VSPFHIFLVAFLIGVASGLRLLAASAPSRTAPPGLIARIVLGGLSGASLCAAGTQSIPLGAALGVAGGLAGTFAGYKARIGLVRALRVPDLVIALSEDAVAIGGSLFLVSRF
jgi:uncharacterized membrane protein